MHVSVVIPCFRAERTIERALGALERQTFRDFETVVVDSGPHATTGQLVGDRFPGVRYERSPLRLEPHAARNRGAELARGELIVFTDADCAAHPDWLAQLVSANRQGHRIVGGAIEAAGHGRRALGIHLCKFGAWVPGGSPGTRTTLPTANLMLDRAAWQDIGPFERVAWSGDTELCWRARRAGYTLAFEPAAIVTHAQSQDLGGFFTGTRRARAGVLRDARPVRGLVAGAGGAGGGAVASRARPAARARRAGSGAERQPRTRHAAAAAAGVHRLGAGRSAREPCAARGIDSAEQWDRPRSPSWSRPRTSPSSTEVPWTAA